MMKRIGFGRISCGIVQVPVTVKKHKMMSTKNRMWKNRQYKIM